jgi:hypothetical protein
MNARIIWMKLNLITVDIPYGQLSNKYKRCAKNNIIAAILHKKP